MSNLRLICAITHLLKDLKEADFTSPGTALRLAYSVVRYADSEKFVAPQNPPGQED